MRDFISAMGTFQKPIIAVDLVAFEAIQRSLVAFTISAELLLSSIEIKEENFAKASADALKAIERSREIANPWLELKGLILVRELTPRRGCQFELNLVERGQVIFKAMQTNVTTPEILPIFEKFVQNSFKKIG